MLYRKRLPIFALKIEENLECYLGKHNDLKREMTSSRERGGAAGTYIYAPL